MLSTTHSQDPWAPASNEGKQGAVARLVVSYNTHRLYAQFKFTLLDGLGQEVEQDRGALAKAQWEAFPKHSTATPQEYHIQNLQVAAIGPTINRHRQ